MPLKGKASPKGIQAIGIGFGVLDCLAFAKKPMPLRLLADKSGLAPSKLRFYLVSFMQLGLVAQDPLSGHYSLGPHAIKLGLAALEQFDVVTASQQALHKVVEELGFSAFLAVWGNRGPTVIFRIDGPKKTVLEIRVGSVLPLMNSAIGRVFLSFMPRSTTKVLLKEELHDSPNLSVEEVERVVKRTTSVGVGVARGTLLAGFTAIAAPIIDHAGMPMAAISIIGPIGSLDDSATGKPTRMLKSFAGNLSEQIGGRRVEGY